ncbi:MAG: AMP-binding protein [Rubrivivax sp.]|nr:AMP-binding protein [Burkholderiales bacterium]MCW5632100.1 AMP-binding protein [Rubrivivax sp.]
MIALRPRPEWAARWHAAGHWREQSILDRVADRIAATPGKSAVIDARGTRLSYAELDHQSSRLAGYLRSQGFAEGDVLTLHLPNWCCTAVVMLAVYKLGGVLHTAPPTYGWSDLAYVLARCSSKAIVAAGRFRSTDYGRHLEAIRRQQALPPICLLVGDGGAAGGTAVGTAFERALEAEPLAAAARCDPDAPAAVLFTSGTESKPKGVVHTHNTLLFGERVFAERLGLGADDACFIATPVSHATGLLHGLVLNLTLGCTLVLQDIFDARRAVQVMRLEGVTWTVGATPFLHDTIEALEAAGAGLPALKFFVCGGAPLPEATVRRAHAAGVTVLPLYGSTESPPHALLRPDAPLQQRWETDGEALPHIEIGVIGADGALLGPGIEGEEVSRGPNLFIGYLDEPGLTARAIDDQGWYRSGDLAVVRSDRTLEISGRIKDIIIRGGQNVSAREVEDLLVEHPAVRRVALVGQPHERLGETAVAVVVLHDGAQLSLADIVEFLAQRGVSRYKLPERLVIRPELPQTPSGKIQKYLIRESLSHAAPDGIERPLGSGTT